MFWPDSKTNQQSKTSPSKEQITQEKQVLLDLHKDLVHHIKEAQINQEGFGLMDIIIEEF